MRAVNLLTPELRSAQKGSGASRPSAMETSGGIGAFALLGALALCVAAVAGYVLAGNVVKERKTTLAAVSAKNDATVKRAADLKPYSDFASLASDRANTVHALAKARFDWEQALRDLSRALPSDVYLSSLKGSIGSGGAGSSGIRSSVPSPAIELTGCTRTQDDVAKLMSRLRNVQGVTRVSLSKSEKAAVVGDQSAAVGPCGKGAPPSFEMAVFFEKATVDADLQAVTGEVPAGTSTTVAKPGDKAGKAADSSSTDSSAAATPTPGATP